ncbi:tyrosine-type recombinase/integrase [Brevibacillus laterosporus]|uniref:tyrosine-type recombinase/integrase n=1 Tax=Brevibacillus laterosporus TaxID=1465 RepID=UPI0018CE3467|nr:tyrosine-type recombinase/integrase [Brevibacillus laterosporus]MBG9796824.1 integrase [Brevibacillus laterosporus]MED1910777.1 tyrosine-type recombinase/integrase [Brevibacillus laterosporus]
MSAKFNFISRPETAKEFNLEKCISEYLAAKRLERRSKKTIEIYGQTLSQFKKWIDKEGHRDISSSVMRDYIHYLSFEKEKWDDHPTNKTGPVGLTPRTVNNNIRNLRVFFNYLVREKIIKTSPVEGLNYQTQVRDTFEIFKDEDVLRLLEAPNTRVYTGLRDYVMMLVLIDTGVRINELTHIKISDVDLKSRQIFIRAEISKTNTARSIPISTTTAKQLERLISFMNVEDTDYLWLTQFGERYFADTFAKMLKRYGKKAGVTGVRVSPHTFRHYFAVKFLKQGGEPIALMRILGHTSLTMTEKYVKYAQGDLTTFHEKASPVTSLLAQASQRKRGKRLFK